MKNEYIVRDSITDIVLRRRSGEIITASISTEDLPRLLNLNNTWSAHWSNHTQSYYVYGNIPGENKKVRLHRLLLGEPNGLVVDHKNHNTLDNTRKNLRILTKSQNDRNRKGANRNSKSGVRGVTWNEQSKKWRAHVRFNNKQIHLGTFERKEEAEEKVKKEREKLFSI